MPAIRFPEWRTENEANNYPFEDRCNLKSSTGFVLPQDAFLDAAFYLRGGVGNVRLSAIDVEADKAVIRVTDDSGAEVRGEVLWNTDVDVVRLVDEYEYAAGALVIDYLRFSIVQTWGSGTHSFADAAAVFVLNTCDSLPASTVTGFLLDDGSVLAGDVILVAEGGMQFSCDQVLVRGECGDLIEERTIVKVSAVGDPLFLRDRCEPNLFATPRFLQELVFQKGSKQVTVGPGDTGAAVIAQVPVLTEDTVLRIATKPEGIVFSMVGQRLTKE